MNNKFKIIKINFVPPRNTFKRSHIGYQPFKEPMYRLMSFRITAILSKGNKNFYSLIPVGQELFNIFYNLVVKFFSFNFELYSKPLKVFGKKVKIFS